MTTKRKAKSESTESLSCTQTIRDEMMQEKESQSSIFLPKDKRRRPIYEEIDSAEAKIEQLENSINDIEDEISETSLPDRKNELIKKKKSLEKQLADKKSEKKGLRIENFEMALLALLLMVSAHLGAYFMGLV